MVSEVCDEDDGAYDGDIIFEEVGVGTYQTHETRKPSADYQGVAPVEVEIEENETTEIEIANTLRRPDRDRQDQQAGLPAGKCLL